jgi:hypothetical protein
MIKRERLLSSGMCCRVVWQTFIGVSAEFDESILDPSTLNMEPAGFSKGKS